MNKSSLRGNSNSFLTHINSATGITLIALCVTIIVLLILVGVTVGFALHENGIIKNSKYAKEATLDAKIAEQERLNQDLEGLGGITGGDSVVVGKLVTGKNKEYTNNGTAVIPVGFAIVPDLDDVSEGLVISDVANDTNNVGNQFVWIPVDKSTFATKFKRTEGYANSKIQSYLNSCGEADANGVNTKITEDKTVSDEAKLMYKSVEKNGGFYIGRYEAGNEGGIYNTETKKWEGESKLVVKKGANVYNNIGWSDSNEMTDVTGGAVELSRKMYTGKRTTNNEIYGVVSTLCYGVQWDAALNFIDSNYITNEIDGKPNCAKDSYLVNSTGKGWYSANYSLGNLTHITGVEIDSVASNKVKNIYDMAGNIYEWTMESYSSGSRTNRGRWIYSF